MLDQHTATVAEKVASAAQWSGVGTAVVSGGAKFLGLTQSEWSIVGVVGGLIVGVLGLVVNAWMTWHFKNKHYRLAERQWDAPLADGED